MKKIVLQLAALFFTAITAMAQAPDALNYQGVARNSSGSPLISQLISLRLTIHNASATGTTVYQETFNPTTNAYGLYNVQIGTGTVVSGTFNSINWGNGAKYLEVEIDPAGGTSYTAVGTNQLQSVPYALYSNTASSLSGTVPMNGDVTGTNAASSVVKLQGNSVSSTAPTSGQVLTWNSGTTSWTPTTPAAGTMTSVTAGAGLSGGTITTSGTISMPNVGTPGTYGSASQIPVITTDAQGRVTGVSNTTLTAGTVTTVNTTPGQLTGGPITTSGTIGLATAGTAGTYGSASQIPVFTTDAYGRVTSVTNTTLSAGTVTSVSDAGLSPLFSASVATPTTTPSISYTLTPAPPHTFLGGAAVGTVTPTYRVLAAGDIPALPYVSSVTAGTGLSGGTITTSGTISLPNVGTAGTYGSATTVPVLTTDAQGRITGVTNTTIATGGIGTVTSITASAPLTGGTIVSSGTIGLSTAGTAGTYGSATQIPVITTDAYGRVTGVTNTAITGLISSGTTNYHSKFTSATSLGNSLVYDNGSSVAIGTASPSANDKLVSINSSTSSFTNAIHGISGSNASGIVGTDAGVLGESNTGVGLVGVSSGASGIYGWSLASGYAGVFGTNTVGGYGIWGTIVGSSGTAGYFDGGTSGGYGLVVANGNSGFGTPTPNATALVDMTSTAKGLLIPRMTAAQRIAISSPATGLLVYQTDATAGFYYYNGVAWTLMNAGLSLSGTNNYMSKFTGASSLGNSLVFDNGTSVAIGTVSPSANDKFYSLNTSTSSFTNSIHAVSGSNAGGIVGTNAAVLGETNSGTGIVGVSSGANGMYGWSLAAGYAGIFGTNSAGGYGIWGAITGTGTAGFFDGGTSGGFGLIVKQGHSGFNTTTPMNMAQVEISGVGTYSVAPVYQAGLVVDGPTTLSATGVYAEGGWKGVFGHNLGTLAGVEAIGVYGEQDGSAYTGTGYGVKGVNLGTGGTANYGVYGSASGSGNGIGGFATGTGAAGYFDGGTTGSGVLVNQGRSGFYTTTPTNMARVEISGVGTYSVAPIYQAGLVVDGPTSVSATGVYAEGGWKGVFGHNLGTSTGVEAIGVYGEQDGSSYTGTGYGVKGVNLGSGGTANYGVFGSASGTGTGVGGQATGTGAAGLFDGGTSGYGVIVKNGLSGFGTTAPVAMVNVSGSKDVTGPTLAGYVLNHQALLAQTTATATSQRANGVVGYSANSSLENDGVDGYVAGTGASFNYGVDGEAVGTTSASNYGVYAYAANASTVTNNYGIYAQSTGWAGYFSGNVHITGSIAKGSGTFEIDHPLDPENKYLYHSFVESPDMMNIYNGNITTDANGDAIVTMPDYFEALNKDFRYQLTVIGTFAQAMVAEKINGNHFKIKTDKPNVEVSWQVTGVRQDKYANAHRVVPEVEKNANDKGYYLHPAEWGQPASKGIDQHNNPKAQKASKASN